MWTQAMHIVHLEHFFLLCSLKKKCFYMVQTLPIFDSVWFGQASIDIHDRKWYSLNVRDVQCKIINLPQVSLNNNSKICVIPVTRLTQAWLESMGHLGWRGFKKLVNAWRELTFFAQKLRLGCLIGSRYF